MTDTITQSLTYSEQEKAVDEAVALFPPIFGLRGYPGERFMVSRGASYYTSGGNGIEPGVYVYTYRWCDKCDPWTGNPDTFEPEWKGFAKGTVRELQREVVKLTCECGNQLTNITDSGKPTGEVYCTTCGPQ